MIKLEKILLSRNEDFRLEDGDNLYDVVEKVTSAFEKLSKKYDVPIKDVKIDMDYNEYRHVTVSVMGLETDEELADREKWEAKRLEKIDEEHTILLIDTVRGLGYTVTKRTTVFDNNATD